MFAMSDSTELLVPGRSPVRRVVLVVLDGLRPDAIERFDLTVLAELARRGASTLTATTVSPSVTAACMASLFTGVPPERHGLTSARSHLGHRGERERSMPKLLDDASLPAEAFLRRMPWIMGGIARRIARSLHVAATFVGTEAPEVLEAALPRLRHKRAGLLLLHLCDGDDAGHAHGWMSAEYARAARRMDATVGRLIDSVALFERDETMLVVLADHGGGGVNSHDHDSAHPLDRTIPIIFAGGGVESRALGDRVSLLDVPPTILWALGVPVPASYAGRPLVELFESAVAAA
jgi:predicted AlkP superfamily pyrophosphatase or phosphodiesterase